MFSLRQLLLPREWPLTTSDSDNPTLIPTDLLQWTEFWGFTQNQLVEQGPRAQTGPDVAPDTISTVGPILSRGATLPTAVTVSTATYTLSAASTQRNMVCSQPSHARRMQTKRSKTIHSTDQIHLNEDPLRSPVTGLCILPSCSPSTDVLCSKAPEFSKRLDLGLRTRSAKSAVGLARIPNRIGDYVCRLCAAWFPDAFALAEHPCPRMASLAYPCDLCSKVFHCPANLASHRRWHKLRTGLQTRSTSPSTSSQTSQAPTRCIRIHDPDSSINSNQTDRPPNLCSSSTGNEEQQRTLFTEQDNRAVVTLCVTRSIPSVEERIDRTFRASKRFHPTSNRKPAPNPYSVEALLA